MISSKNHVTLSLGITLGVFGLQATLCATDGQWIATSNGTWSNTANWADGTPPSNDGTATVSFNGSTSGTSTVGENWSVNGLIFEQGTTSYTLRAPDANGTALSIGAGGITSNKSSGRATLAGNLNLTANQSWFINAGSTIAFGYPMTLTGSGDLTKEGAGQLIVSGNFSPWDGALVVENGSVMFNTGSHNTAGGLLGGSDIRMQNSNATSLYFNHGEATESAPAVLSGNILFENTGNQIVSFTTSGSPRGALNFSGNWSSDTPLTNLIRFTDSLMGVNMDGSAFRFHLSGDNSGLTSALNGGATREDHAISINAAFVQVDSANALGLGNTLSVSLGQNSDADSTRDRSSGLFTTNSNDIASQIMVLHNIQASGKSHRSYLGLTGAGAATFSGDITLQSSNNVNHKAAIVHLRADVGGTATFSGRISDQSSASTNKVRQLFVEGGGTIILTGDNNYSANTIVQEDTTLLVNNTSGSATGTGEVEVQDGSRLGGAGTIAGNVSLQSGASLSPGNSLDGGVNGTLRLAQLTWSSNDTSGGMYFSLSPTPGESDQLLIDGAFIKADGSQFLFIFDGLYSAATSYTLISFGSVNGFTLGDFSANIDGAFSFDNNALVFTTAVPEPATVALLTALAAGATLLLRRRTKKV